jgi:hypothetical protein
MENQAEVNQAKKTWKQRWASIALTVKKRWKHWLARLALYAAPTAFFVVGLVNAISADTVWARHTGRAVLVASAIMIVLILLLDLIQITSSTKERKHYGAFGVLIGADGRLSTSKAQVALWTYGFVYACLYLAMMAAFIQGITVFGSGVWDDYLVLLGGPFAAALIAKGVVLNQLAGGKITQVPTSAASKSALRQSDVTAEGTAPAVRDLVSSDDGNLDLVDSQYFLFNIVAFSYATAVFLSHQFNGSVPDDHKFALAAIPGVLLTLTGASAATYVANKTARSNAPRVSNVIRATEAGGNGRILGVNFVPPGLSAEDALKGTSITLTPADTTKTADVAPSLATVAQLTFTEPNDLFSQAVSVVVTTASGQQTAAYLAPPRPA